MAGQLTIDTLKASSGILATQNGMTGIAKAWVQYNAITQTIGASFNVSSVTYNSTGLFTINFTTAFSNANYVCAGFAQEDTGGGLRVMAGQGTPTTTSRQVETRNSSASYVNCAWSNVAIFGS